MCAAGERAKPGGRNALGTIETPPRRSTTSSTRRLGHETVSTEGASEFASRIWFAEICLWNGKSRGNFRDPDQRYRIFLAQTEIGRLAAANIYRSADRQIHTIKARSVKYVSDMRVVYEIQSRLRSDQDDLQKAPEESLPKAAPDKNPGQTDDRNPALPRQQNRANEVAHRLEFLAAQCPVFYERSFR